MRIKWGMPNLLELESLERNIEICGQLGLDFIELNMNLPECQPNRIDVDKLARLMETHGVFYTFHAPETIDVANFDDDIREAYFLGIAKTINIAKKLNAPIINVHMNLGVYFTLPNEKVYLYQRYEKEYLERIGNFADYVEDLLRNTGVKISIENTGVFDIDFVQKAVNILLAKDNIVLTWDIGHDFSSGYKDKAFILENNDDLAHMHIHDAVGPHNHLPVYTGELDINDRLNVARDKGCSCVIEVKTLDGLVESIKNIKKNRPEDWL